MKKILSMSFILFVLVYFPFGQDYSKQGVTEF